MQNKTTDELVELLWEYNCIYDELSYADAIIVLGSNDIRVAQYGAELYLQGLAPLLIFSGNVGKLTKDIWDRPESEVFAEEAIRLGVASDAILIEKESTNTGENIAYTKQLIEEKNIGIKKVILVQKPYMQKRAYATIRKVWPEVLVQVTAPSYTFQNGTTEFVSKEELISIIVGDTQRIIEYPKKGFQVEQGIPLEIKEALNILIKRGFTSHTL